MDIEASRERLLKQAAQLETLQMSLRHVGLTNAAEIVWIARKEIEGHCFELSELMEANK